MKRYLAFYGDYYYPMEGMGDFVGDYDNIEDAIKAVEKEKGNWRPDDIEWQFCFGVVWDSLTRQNVYEK